MSLYVKLSTMILLDPKIIQAGPDGFTLWAKGLCYSAEHMTDGYVASGVLPVLGIGMADVQAVAQRLVDCGLWRVCEDGFCIGADKWAKWQTTREQVEQKRIEAKERQKKSRELRNSHANVTALSHASHTEVGLPEPEPEPEPELTIARKFVKPTVEEVSEYMTLRNWANPDLEAEKFVAYYEDRDWKWGKTKTPMKDWKRAVIQWESPERLNKPTQEKPKIPAHILANALTEEKPK